MKFKFAAGAIACASLALPGALSAEDGLKYEELVHCAATNMVIAQVLGMDGDEIKNKADIDKFKHQAAALMTIAAVGSKKDTDTVFADTQKEQSVVIAALGDKAKSDAFMKTDIPHCKDLGEAAVQVIEESSKK